MFSLNSTLKKVGRSGDGKRNNLLGWPNGIAIFLKTQEFTGSQHKQALSATGQP